MKVRYPVKQIRWVRVRALFIQVQTASHKKQKRVKVLAKTLVDEHSTRGAYATPAPTSHLDPDVNKKCSIKEIFLTEFGLLRIFHEPNNCGTMCSSKCEAG